MPGPDLRRVAAAVLAAGGGRRMAGAVAKPLQRLGGRPLVHHALAAARGSGLRPVLLVVGHDGEAVGALAPPDVVVVLNPEHREGIASSLRAALAVLAPTDVVAVVVGLADQPLVGPDAYRRVAAAYDDGARLAVATYGGVRANPVLLAREHWREATDLAGDVGARALMARHPVVEVPCDGTGDPTDVDTASDLAALEARWRSATASE